MERALLLCSISDPAFEYDWSFRRTVYETCWPASAIVIWLVEHTPYCGILVAAGLESVSTFELRARGADGKLHVGLCFFFKVLSSLLFHRGVAPHGLVL